MHKLYSHPSTGTRFKSSSERQEADLRQVKHLITVNRKHQVDIARLERHLDEAHFRNGQYSNFIEILKNRYPSQYVDVVEEFNKVTEPDNGGLQNSSERS
jgi:hypothetical protein